MKLSRRAFVKNGALFVPTLFLPRNGLGQLGKSLPFLAQSGNACASACTFATDWCNRAVANGGGVASDAAKTAICNFQNGLIADSLDSQMIAWNTIVSGNLITGLTPQLLGPGTRDPWLGVDLVSGDLTTAGLTGDAISKRAQTGWFSDVIYSSVLDAGFCLYVTAVTATGIDYGVGFGGAAWYELGAKFTDNNTYDRNGGIGTTISLASPGPGFYSSQRTGATNHKLYFGNAGNAHAQIGSESIDVTGVALPHVESLVLAFELNGAGFFTSDTIGFVGVTHGLSAAQDAALFARVQTLMTDLGRAV